MATTPPSSSCSSSLESSWSPNERDLQQAVLLLQALRDPTRPDHSAALASLETLTSPSCSSSPSSTAFILHILHVFAYGMHYHILVDLRQLSGLILKNSVLPHLSALTEEVQRRIKEVLVVVLGDDSDDLRKTAAILIGKLTECSSSSMAGQQQQQQQDSEGSDWASLIVYIISLLDLSLLSTQPKLLDGALLAMQRVCEDSSSKMAAEDRLRPLDSLVPRLIALLAAPLPAIRLHALECYNCLLYLLEGPNSLPINGLRSRNSSFDSAGAAAVAAGGGAGAGGVSLHSPQANLSHPLVVHMQRFIEGIAALGQDQNSSIRKQVCQSLTVITCLHIALLEPYMTSIVEYMLTMLMDGEDEAVAMEACEFFMALLVETQTRKILLPVLSRLVHHIITRLYLTPEQMEAERIEEEEESTGAKQVTLQPIHHRSSSSSDHDHDYNDQDDASQKWTLRKQAALLLDNLAQAYDRQLVLTIALPLIQNYFSASETCQHPVAALYNSNSPYRDILIKESGMLALGALCNGCLDHMLVYIPQLFPFLLQNLLDPLPEMRSITCWVLSNAEQGSRFYIQSLYAILNTMFDPTPKVQIAACSALCILIENSFTTFLPPPPPTSPLTPPSPNRALPSAIIAGSQEGEEVEEEENLLYSHLAVILCYIHHAFDHYGNKAQLILIDTIGTLADTLQLAFLPSLTTASGSNHVLSHGLLRGLSGQLRLYGVTIHPQIMSLLQQLDSSLANLLLLLRPHLRGGEAAATTAAIAMAEHRCRLLYIELYFPKICRLFAALDDDDHRLFPILECYTSLLSLIGKEVEAYMPYVFYRCLKLMLLATLPSQQVASLLRALQGQVNGHLVQYLAQRLEEEEEGLLCAQALEHRVTAEYIFVILSHHPRQQEQEEEVLLHKDYAICACDVMSSLSESFALAFGATFLPRTTSLLLYLVLGVLCKDPLPECRQSAFSLLGELAKHSVEVLVNYQPGVAAGGGGGEGVTLQPLTLLGSTSQALARSLGSSSSGHISISGSGSGSGNSAGLVAELMACCIANLDVAYPLVCNNAAWTIGELVMSLHSRLLAEDAAIASGTNGSRAGGGGGHGLLVSFLQSYIHRIMVELITALQSIEMNDNLKVNIAVTIARCAIVCPYEVAELADEFFADWCSILTYPCPSLERYQAFSGMLSVLHHHPELLLDNKTNLYSLLCAAIAYHDVPADIAKAIHDVLLSCRAHNASLWSKVLRPFSQAYNVDILYQMYALHT
eukprot:gene7116-7868_t